MRRAPLAVALAFLLLAGAAGAQRRMPQDVRVAWSGSSAVRQVAITFDDGPSAENTPAILDLLQRANARATFFVVGRQVEGGGETSRRLLRRMIQEGHEVGNHSWSHPYTSFASSEGMRREVERTQAAVEEACGVRPRLFRPPGGRIDFSTVRSLATTDIETVVMWSLDPSDWSDPGKASIWERVAAGLQPGAIILFHDTKAETVKALPLLLDLIQAQGYELVTISDLLEGSR